METRLTETASAAKLAVFEVGARVYQLTGFSGDQFKFFVHGCAGIGKKQPSGEKTQEQVVKLMEAVAQTDEPAFVLALGDNMYDYGACSPLTEQESGYHSCFYVFYKNAKYPIIARLPFFLMLGNHEANRCKKAHYQPWLPQGEAVEINQVAHSYLPEGEHYPSIAAKQKLFQQETLSLSEIGKWNMPYFFYSLIAGDTQIFCLNANTLLADFLDWHLEKKIEGHVNQVEWLLTNYKIAKEHHKQVMIALHNPLKTVSKRALPKNFDTNYYLTQDQLIKLQSLLHTNSQSYSDLLYLFFIELQIHPDIFFTAHDHAMTFYNNKQSNNEIGLCQVGSGGGGGDLQKRKVFNHDPYLGCYLKNYGFVAVQCELYKPREIFINYYTTNGHHLQFSHTSHEPLRIPNEDEAVETLRRITLEACVSYLQTLKENKNMLTYFSSRVDTIRHYIFSNDNGTEDCDRVHDIMAYLNQPYLKDIDEVLKDLNHILEQLADKDSDGSFLKIYEKLLLAYPLFTGREKIYHQLFLTERALAACTY